MDSLRQYIELYKQHTALIDRNSAAPLNALRSRACAILESKPLPPYGSENYETTDLNRLLEPDFGLNIAKLNLDVNPAASFRCDVPRLAANLFIVANDTPIETSSSYTDMPEGVEIGSLREFARRKPEEIADFYGTIADLENPIVALNTLLAQDGIYMRVRKGVRLERPIQIVNILNNMMPLMAVRRMLIIMEEESAASMLICDHTQIPDIDLASLETIEIVAGKNASLNFYTLEESSETTSRLSALYLRQWEGSKVTIDSVTLLNGYTRNEYYCRFVEKNASLRLLGMGIEDMKRNLSTYSRVEHNAPDCHTEELFKYVVDDEASGAFTGMIYVAPGAEKTEAYQSNRNLVGSDKASMFSKPQLEIYNDDVKCSHGAATGQLDETQIFYMRSRGLSLQKARLLLKQAFMADIIDAVELPVLRERLHTLVERRFAGEHTSCGSCSLCSPEL